MRVSCVAFARILDQNRYVLLRNAGMLRKEGKLRFGPVGGGLQCSDSCRQKLIESFGAYDFEGDIDLRFMVPDDHLQGVIEWFTSREDRETSVLREVYEELYIEEHILSEAQADLATEVFAGFSSMLGKPKPRHNMTATVRLLEIYDVTMPSMALRALRRHARYKDRIYLATEEEIRNCQDLGGGYSVASTAISLLNTSSFVDLTA